MLKLSEFTLDVLKNFAAINPNLVVKEGSTFSTIAEAKNIMATVTIPESFDRGFGIYDLNEFISALSLLGDPTIVLEDESAVLSKDAMTLKYRFANPSVLTTPQKEIKMPQAELTIVVSENLLSQIRRASGVLGHSVVALKGDASGALNLVVLDPKDPSANSLSIKLSETHGLCKEFSLEFLIDNLKFLPGEYKVEISSKLISKWSHQSYKLEYFVALEKTSTI